MKPVIQGLEALHGVPKTLCIPLLARARSRNLTPHLEDFDDPIAREWGSQIGIDPTWIEGDRMILESCIARARVLDRETRTFLEEDPDAPITIVSVGAGLCTRMDRLHLTDRIQSGKSNLIWVDLDLPEVIALRKRLQPAAGTHVYISKSLADPAWFDELPSLNGHRILVLIEGVFVYLSPQVIRAFLYDTVKFFEKSGAIQFRFAFDLLDGPALSASGASSSIRKTGARLHWAPWSLAAFIQSTGTNLTVRRRTDLIRDLRGVLPLLHWVYQKFRGNPVYSIAVIEAGPGR